MMRAGDLVTVMIAFLRDGFGIYFYEERGKFYFIDHETKQVWRFTADTFRNSLQRAINAAGYDDD